MELFSGTVIVPYVALAPTIVKDTIIGFVQQITRAWEIRGITAISY